MEFDLKSKEKSSVFKEKFLSLGSSTPFLLSSLGLPIIFILYVLYAPSFFIGSAITRNFHGRTTIVQSYDECDFSKGHWVWDGRGPLYTNYSCTTIPVKRNCFLHGRRDTDFLHWRWKPDQCELPRFDPKVFLSIVRGKTMAFIGDSLARNQMESLLCLLSKEENPVQQYKDKKNSFVTWKFPHHNFTLMVFWTPFLVTVSERIINGSSTGGFDLQLDKVDDRWSRNLPLFNYAIFSDAPWLFRSNYLYEHGKLIGCVYCEAPNITHFVPDYAIRRVFRTAFERINGCKNCSGLLTLLRTYSPVHFENGAWDKGGYCNRTRPSFDSEKEVMMKVSAVGALDLDHRNVQVEEFGKAKKVAGKDKIFEIVDITRAMQMRPDGHPGLHWGNSWMVVLGINDCIHWCLPGPVDTWNEILLWILKKHSVNQKPSLN